MPMPQPPGGGAAQRGGRRSGRQQQQQPMAPPSPRLRLRRDALAAAGEEEEEDDEHEDGEGLLLGQLVVRGSNKPLSAAAAAGGRGPAPATGQEQVNILNLPLPAPAGGGGGEGEDSAGGGALESAGGRVSPEQLESAEAQVMRLEKEMGAEHPEVRTCLHPSFVLSLPLRFRLRACVPSASAADCMAHAFFRAPLLGRVCRACCLQQETSYFFFFLAFCASFNLTFISAFPLAFFLSSIFLQVGKAYLSLSRLYVADCADSTAKQLAEAALGRAYDIMTSCQVGGRVQFSSREFPCSAQLCCSQPRRAARSGAGCMLPACLPLPHPLPFGGCLLAAAADLSPLPTRLFSPFPCRCRCSAAPPAPPPSPTCSTRSAWLPRTPTPTRVPWATPPPPAMRRTWRCQTAWPRTEGGAWRYLEGLAPRHHRYHHHHHHHHHHHLHTSRASTKEGLLRCCPSSGGSGSPAAARGYPPCGPSPQLGQ